MSPVLHQAEQAINLLTVTNGDRWILVSGFIPEVHFTVLSRASQCALFPIRTSLTTATKAIYALGALRWRQFCLAPASIRPVAQYTTSWRRHRKFLGICLRAHETSFVQTGWQL